MKNFFLIVILCAGCGQTASSGVPFSIQDIRAIRVSQFLPLINEKGKIFRIDSADLDIYYSGKIRLYKMQYRYDSIAENGKIILSEKRYHYFIHHQDSVYGYHFDSRNKSVKKRRETSDSVFENEWFRQTELTSNFLENKTQLISVSRNTDSGTLHESYILAGKRDTGITGTMTLDYDKKLNGISFSFSKELDSTRQMKLIKVIEKYNQRFDKTYETTIDARELVFNLKDLSLTDRDREQIAYYFKEYMSLLSNK